MEQENDNNLADEQVEEEIVNTVEETVDELSVEDELAKAHAEAAKWRRIAQKNQRQETVPEPRIIHNPDLSDELKLIARGLSDEEIEQAKIIAKGKGIVLTEAIKDPLFTIYQNDLKEKQRKEDAKLGASKGSGESGDSSLIKPDMTREEHLEAFQKVMGN